MDYAPELIAKAKTAKSAEELCTLAAENGITITEEEAKGYFAQLHKEFTSLADAALSDEELEQVAGGKGGNASTEANYPDPKYHKGQRLWIYYPSTHNYLGIKILETGGYLEGRGWEYLVLNEYGCEESYYLDYLGGNDILTYKP